MDWTSFFSSMGAGTIAAILGGIFLAAFGVGVARSKTKNSINQKGNNNNAKIINKK